MPRLNIERQKELEPTRIELAIEEIEFLGYEIDYRDVHKIQFEFKGSMVTLYPYSGWHTGKTITDGRGIKKLLEQIRK